MTTTVDTQNPTEQSSLESVILAISKLTLKDKEKLVDVIEQQIFEEEENYEEDAETAAIAKMFTRTKVNPVQGCLQSAAYIY